MKVIFVTGTWDLFHIGHLRRLQGAKELGDYLVVGVITDECAQTYKDKPVIPYKQRKEVVGGLECVDFTWPHNAIEATWIPEGYIDAGHEVVRVVGPEFGKLERQQRFLEWAKENGVEVVVMPRTPDISTTKIKESIKNG